MKVEPLKIGVVGARRARQGTGEYLARDLARAGCSIRALVGTSPASQAAAQAGLRERYGIECAAYGSLTELLEREEIDAVVIASPPETHRELLQESAAAGCHVLAEKPLWWSERLLEQPAAELAAEVDALTSSLRAQGLYLHLNAQWPYTLPAFRELHPDLPAGPPQHFHMWLAPNSRGTTMVADSASHLLSMLHALAGPGELRDVEIELEAPSEGSEEALPEALTLRAAYHHGAGACQVRFDLRRCAEVPRPAGYAIDGREAHRRVAMPDYRLSFAAPRGASVPLPDPLTASVEAFVHAVRAGGGFDPRCVRDGMLQLQELVQALASKLGGKADSLCSGSESSGRAHEEARDR